ncbi:Phytosulfokine [Hibiscus syriacus]|uniref:Phytosulfokine n=2 Tax=Hibiscus syriacus TaxID=106335 RepID=A0A6A2Z6T3_HIBSY|nr:Phytosulfokine [Hibiscus syriacus]
MIIVFLLFFILHSPAAARPEPASTVQYADTPFKPQHLGEEKDDKVQELEDSCEGIVEEECLMRKTLAAHIDYIYTQKTNP